MTKEEANKGLEEYGYFVLKPIHPKSQNEYYFYRKNYGYVATVNLYKDSISFQRKKYTNFKELVNAIEEYEKTLEFRSDTYDPDVRPEYVMEQRIHDTLIKYGFVENKKHYNLGNHNVYFSEGVLGSKYGEICKNSWIINENSFIKLYNEDETDSKKAVDTVKGIITASYVADIAKLIGFLNDNGRINTIKDITIKTLNPNTLEIEEKNGKEGIIRLLEDTLEKLKNE